MTYRGFHYRFNAGILLVLAAIAFVDGILGTTLVVSGVLSIVVIAFTFPWDNAAVRRGIWDFPEDRILFRVQFLPIEEILFFVLQTLIVGLFTSILSSRLTRIPTVVADITSPTTITSILLVLCVWGTVGYLTRRRRRERRRSSYADHLLFWFLPIIVLQWTFGWQILAPYADLVILSASVWGAYYTLADIVAVRQGIWFFDREQTTGLTIGPLPWEEVAFFFLTSLLVAQSVLLLLPQNLR